MKLSLFIKQAAFLALTALASHAAIVYQFTGIPGTDNPNGVPQAFELVVPDFLKIAPGGNQFFNCSGLSVALNCQGDVIFSMIASPNQGYAAEIQFSDMGPQTYSYLFPTASFTQVGTYYSMDFGFAQVDQAFLRVSTSVGSPAPVPEPSTMLLAGLACLMAGWRRTASKKCNNRRFALRN